MARALMLLGTHSNAGKSLLATAFCRILARQGVAVAPFKAQNMSNNAGVTPEGGEMGRAQIVQAEAAGIPPHTDMNPVLLKPEGNRRSQIVLNGRVQGHIESANWFDLKRMLRREVVAAYDRLAARYDVIILEGAGSPAEINLKAGDIVNLSMARHADAPCLLVGDIDRGGVFAALAGTMLLLDPEERAQVRGFLINKFRGDPSLLGDATAMLQERAYGVPTLGVIPFVPDLRIADEDAVALDAPRAGAFHVAEPIDIAVIHLPHIANFDEFDALAAEPIVPRGTGHEKVPHGTSYEDVRLRFVRDAAEFGRPDAVILPGTKATLTDLAWLRERGLDHAVLYAHAYGAAIVGICGGYQLLGERLTDPAGVEGPVGGEATGLGLLPVATEFAPVKHTHRATLRLQNGPLQNGEVVEGYEIHTGETHRLNGAAPFGEIIRRDGDMVSVPDGATGSDGRVWGCYLHGIFENDHFRDAWLQTLGRRSGGALQREAEYDRIADVVLGAVDWPRIAALLGLD